MAKKSKSPRIDVMVSSTVRDLKDHRATVRDAILQAGMFPLRMEEAGAQTDTNAITFSRDLVRHADVYVGLFAFHYGYVPEDDEQTHPSAVVQAPEDPLSRAGRGAHWRRQPLRRPFGWNARP